MTRFSRPDASRSVVDPVLGRTLLRTRVAVVVTGVAVLLAGLGATQWLHAHARVLAAQHDRVIQDTMTARTGVRQSVTILRSWVIEGTDAAKPQRTRTWRATIDPVVDRLSPRDSDSPNPESLARWDRLTTVLGELRTWQWWIEEVGPTPGNRPARAVYFRDLQPIAEDVDTGSQALLTQTATGLAPYESGLAVADFRDAFARSDAALARFVETGLAGDAHRSRVHLGRAGAALTKVGEHGSGLSTHGQEILAWLERAAAAFLAMANQLLADSEQSVTDLAQQWLTTEATPRARAADNLLETIATDRRTQARQDAAHIATLERGVIAGTVLLMIVPLLTSLRGIRLSLERATGSSRSQQLANPADTVNRPLDTIIETTVLLLDSRPTQAQREYLETIRASSDSLLQLVDLGDATALDAEEPAADKQGPQPSRANLPETKTHWSDTLPPGLSRPVPLGISSGRTRGRATRHETLDWAHAMAAVKGDRVLLRRVITTHLTECPGLRDELRTAITSGDAAVVSRAAQTIKGGLRSFGEPRAVALAYRLEEAGRRGWLESAAEQCTALEQELDRVDAELRAFVGSPEGTGELEH